MLRGFGCLGILKIERDVDLSHCNHESVGHFRDVVQLVRVESYRGVSGGGEAAATARSRLSSLK